MTIQQLPRHPQCRTIQHVPDTASTGLTVQDQRRIQDALDSSTSANTRRAYNQAWRRFEAWAKERGRGHPLPATPELLAAFLAELAEDGKSVATLRLTKSALAAVHRSTGHQDPTDNEGGEEGHGRHCPGQRPPPAPGEAAYRDRPGGGEGHGQDAAAAPGTRQAGRERSASRAPRAGGRRPVIGSPGRLAPPIGSLGAPVGRRGDPG